MNKNLLPLFAAASMLSSCASPRGDYIETQVNFIGNPVRACVESSFPPCPPHLIGIEPDRYGKLLRLEAKEEWQEKEQKYKDGYTHEKGW